jgi:4-amino-4-deoxy-L-arabinose transferase-like glycosyltransferase
VRAALRDGPARTAAGIVLAAAALRLWGLARLPPGPFVDEAYTVYDAFSILQTGRDLWGTRLPVYFPSWGGDAVEGLYRYLCVPFVAALGPGALSARLPAALAGTLAVLFTYMLGRRLLGPWPGCAAALLLALSPWHVAFSRIAFRGILLPTLAVAAAWAAAAAAGMGQGGRRPRRWIVAAVLLGLTVYTYSTAKLFVPLFVVLLAWVFRDEIRRRPVAAAGVAGLVVLMAVPALLSTFGGRGQVRFERISVFRPSATEAAAEALSRDHPWLGAAARAPAVATAWRLGSNYVSHFRPDFLLLRGDTNLRHSPSGIGQLLWPEAILLALGVGLALWRRSRVDLWLLGWMLLGPVADSLTTDRVPNALRALAMLPAVQLLAGSGVAALLTGMAGWGRNLVLTVTAAGAILLGVDEGRFLRAYAGPYAAVSAPYWNAGYPEAVRWMAEASPPGAALLVARPEPWRVERYGLNPYYHALILLYAPIPPATFLERGLARWQVLRIPDEGTVSARQVPEGAWLLLPGDRADPGAVRRWIAPPEGGEPLAVIVGTGNA